MGLGDGLLTTFPAPVIHGLPDVQKNFDALRRSFGTSTFINVVDRGIKPGTVGPTAIADLIATLPAGGGTLYWPAGEYDFDNSAAHAITAVDGLVILGDGRSTILKGTGAGGFALINATGTVRCEVRYVQLQGTAGAGRSDGIKHSGTDPGGYVADHVYFNGFSYAVFFPGYTGTDDGLVATHNKNGFIDVADCEIQGQATAYPTITSTSDGITHQGATGRVRVRNTYIHHVGRDADFHHHCIYLSRGCDTIIDGCTFDYVVGGRGIQFEDQITNYPTTGVVPNHQLVANCTFGSNYTGTNEGQSILTSSALSTTEVIGCRFNTPKKGIELRGKFLIADCIFNQSDTGFPSVYTNDTGDTQSFPVNPTYHTATGTLRGCTWIGSSLYDVQVLTVNGIFNDITLEDCHFLGATTDAHVRIMSPADSSSVWLKGCRLSGSGALVAALWADSGALVEMNDCTVRPTNANAKAVRCGPTSAPTTFRLRRNELSQGGSSVVFDIAPGTFEHENNFGSKGYRSLNSGQASVADGGSIDLGLGSGGSYPPGTLNAVLTAMTAGQIATVSATPAYSSTELNPNTGVETTLGNWTKSTNTASTLARVATPGGFTGNASSWVARFQYSSTGNDFAQVLSEFGTTGHVVTAGQYYQAFGDIYVAAAAAAGFRLGVRWWAGASNISTSLTTGSAQTGTGVWSKTGTFQAPATATRAAVVFQWTTVNGDTIDAYVDNLSLRASGTFAAVNLRLHDGTTPGGAQNVQWMARAA